MMMFKKKYLLAIYLDLINFERKKEKNSSCDRCGWFHWLPYIKRLLDEGWRIIGLDCMSDYYDVALKERRRVCF